MTKKKYEIKSNVRKSICQSFINYLVYNRTPKINILNISEYDNLSQEFEFMVNIIQLYKNNIIEKSTSQLFFLNQELKTKLQSVKTDFSQTTENYHKIIQYLFDEDKISPNSFHNPYLRSDLYRSCLKEKVEFVYFLTRKILIQNGLVYFLNEEKKTAEVVGCYLSNEFSVTIPKFVIYESREYMVEIIHKEAFKKSDVSEIKFEDNFVLKIIEDEVFFCSSLFSIRIPKHVTRIDTRAFFCCFKLSSLTCSKKIADDSFDFSYLNSCEFPPRIEEVKDCANDSKRTDKFLLGKTNPNVSNFDVLISYNGFYKSIQIPSFIKRIAPSAFYNVGTIEDVTFSDDSKLESIGSYSFGHCCIRDISIPSNVIIIEEGAFLECNNLEKVTFYEDSKLLTIEKKAFCATGIQSLSIPSSVIELKSRWCEETPNLVDVKISPKSSNFSYLENGLIIGKSEASGDIYDTIIFAPRNIEEVIIPSFIKKIAGAAFSQCSNLKRIEFPKNSKLEIIEKNGLSNIPIKNISIPKHVKEIGSMAFYSNRMLNNIEFTENSELQMIKKLAFYGNPIRKILFPSSLKRIEEEAFFFCQKLKNIDFNKDCHLKFIGKSAFRFSEIESFSIPSSVNCIGKNAFSNCFCLQIIEINEYSQLEKIRNDWFENSPNVILMNPPNFIHTHK